MKDLSIESPVIKTDAVRIRDSNNGSYAGNQFSVDTGSLTSSNDMFSVADAHLEIPYTITVENVDDLTKAHFLLALKHGYYSKVNGIAVKLDNQPLCNFTNLSNLYTHFNILSSWTEGDVKRDGDLIGFFKDSAGGYSHKTVSSSEGVGECTNPIANLGEVLATESTYYQAHGNDGFLKKAKAISYNEADAVLAPFCKTGRASEIFKSNKTDNGGTTITYNVCAIVRLADIHDCFKTMPIMRNPNLNIVVQFHSCNATLPVVTNNYTTAVVLNPVHNFCSWQVRQLASDVIATTTSAIVTESMKNTAKSIVELVIPRIQMNEEDEMNYINQMGKEHMIKYTDIHSNTETVASPAVSWMVNSALSAMTGFLMLIRLGSNGQALTANNTPLFTTDHSPFTSAPNYLCSSQAVANLQLYVSNRPVFESPVTYNYDMYLNMIREKGLNNNSVNGGVGSGLISRQEWEESNYGYIYVKLPQNANKMADQSLQVRFTNDNNAKVTRLDLLAFIEVEKAYTLDVNAGKIKILY